jgi:hypothetical protein
MVFEDRGQRERALDLLRRASDIAHANPVYDADAIPDAPENQGARTSSLTA